MIVSTCRWLLGGLLFSLTFAPQEPGTKTGPTNSTVEGTSPSLTLTSQRTSGYFPVPAEVLRAKPRVLFVSVAKVVNPRRTSFEILAYLQPVAANKAAEKILLGNFSLYPPDQPAGFQLSTSEALSKLTAATSKPDQVQVVFEIRKFRETDSWTGLEVTFVPPVWRDK